jgi:stromal membrane-associated protein
MASKDKVSEKVQEAIFTQLLSLPGNGECADCGNRSPTWVSLDFGVFVCIRCSGVHRQIGPHITRVRSTKLDGWQKDNIEIMATIGNKLANDYYEYKMPVGYRKPGANSTPEECRRFVDEKYIRKAFSPPGYQEPVKDFLACKAQGTKPTFEYAKSAQHHEVHPKHHTEQGHGREYIRKKSMSLDKLGGDNHKKVEEKETHHKAPEGHKKMTHYHSQDLLSPDDDLLGSHSHNDANDFGDFKQATHSASPVKKINFANFKKAHNQANEQQQQNQGPGQNQQQAQSHWDWNFPTNQSTNQNTNANTSSNNNNTNPSLQNQDQQKQAENKVDVMKLYNQSHPMGHQNHFMQGHGQMQGGWNYNNNWNQGMQGGFPQNNFQGGYPPNYGGQQGMMGYNYPQMGGNMVPNAGYGQGPVVGHYGGNLYQNNGFVQAPNANKFF